MSTHVAHQFDDAGQQFDAARLGMWIFLATEVMFFGGLFTGYTYYRIDYPQAFVVGSLHLDLLAGTINTAVLLTSSLTVALAVRAAQTDQRTPCLRWLLATIALGTIFLAIKGFEYYQEFAAGHVPGPRFHLAEPVEGVDPRNVSLFFSFYFGMTGLHAVHMIVGLGLVGTMCFWARRSRFSSHYFTPVELTGLYWHFVDIIWVFLFPLLYLVR